MNQKNTQRIELRCMGVIYHMAQRVPSAHFLKHILCRPSWRPIDQARVDLLTHVQLIWRSVAAMEWSPGVNALVLLTQHCEYSQVCSVPGPIRRASLHRYRVLNLSPKLNASCDLRTSCHFKTIR